MQTPQERTCVNVWHLVETSPSGNFNIHTQTQLKFAPAGMKDIIDYVECLFENEKELETESTSGIDLSVRTVWIYQDVATV